MREKLFFTNNSDKRRTEQTLFWYDVTVRKKKTDLKVAKSEGGLRILGFTQSGELVTDHSALKKIIVWDNTGKIIRKIDASNRGFSYSARLEENGTLVIPSEAAIVDLNTGEKKQFYDQEKLRYYMPSSTFNYSERTGWITLTNYLGRFFHDLMGTTEKPNNAEVLKRGEIRLFNTRSKENRVVRGGNSVIDYLKFVANDSILICRSFDNKISFIDVASGKQIIEVQSFSGGGWVARTPDGLFDASPEMFKDLYYVKGLEVIELDQLKERFYEPNLLQKKLGFTSSRVRSSRGLGLGLNDMFPQIDLKQSEGDLLRINLKNQGGGIGSVKILINKKEAVADARIYSKSISDSIVSIEYSFKGHPFLLHGKMNEVEVVAMNKEEYLQSKPKKYSYIHGHDLAEIQTKFYGVFVGVSDYNGLALDLKYSGHDAESLSESVSSGANKLFGKDNTHIATFSSERGLKDSKSEPTKENIHNYFIALSKQVKPFDVLMIFLAGHGVNYGGEDGDFYFLTSEASTADLKDPVVRKSIAISSNELTEYIKLIPSLRQVLILDACYSGQFAYNLLASARSDKPSSEIRALERMKDRTGLYVLSGSAADAVSYEASTYGQGLLTYSLLFGLKGAALRDNRYVDVMNWFQFAADEVPKLAEDIGGIQKPEIRAPYGARSFDIGVIDEEAQRQIKIPEPKPLFVKSVFSDENTFNDDLRIAERVDEKFQSVQSRDGSIVFINTTRFPNAYSVKGRYVKQGTLMKAQVKVFRGDVIHNSFEVEAVNVDELVLKVLEKTESIVFHK